LLLSAAAVYCCLLLLLVLLLLAAASAIYLLLLPTAAACLLLYNSEISTLILPVTIMSGMIKLVILKCESSPNLSSLILEHLAIIVDKECYKMIPKSLHIQLLK